MNLRNKGVTEFCPLIKSWRRGIKIVEGVCAKSACLFVV